MIGDTDYSGYGLYALREFKKGDVLGLYMGQYVDSILNENNNEYQLKNLAADGKNIYMGMHFINNQLYNFYSKNK